MKNKILLAVILSCSSGFLLAQNTFPSSGNVGIGTLSPTHQLQVNGNVLISDGSLIFISPATLPGGPRFDVSGNGMYLHLQGRGLIARTNNEQDLGSSAFRFRNLWLGSNLYVGGSTYINGEHAGVIVDANNQSRVGFIKYPTRAAGIWRAQNQEFEIGRTNTPNLPSAPSSFTTDFYIAGNGNVGIGTKTPNQKLSVNGFVLAKKVKITLNASDWADYVFDSSYTLLPLANLEQFIQKHKHLPEIPTAQQVADEGLDIAKTQSLLLKKIEELTLYIIQQDKDLKEQKEQAENRNRQLRARIEAMEASLPSDSRQ